MASRPRAGRGMTGRDGSKDVDQPSEADLIARITDGLRKAQEHLDESERLGQDIMTLETDIKAQESGPTLDQHKLLDQLYRNMLKTSEDEKKVLGDHTVIDLVAILQAMRAADEPAPRNGTVGKGRKHQRPTPDEPAVADSPGPSPNDSRVDILKRAKGTGQRSSSVASSSRSGAALKDGDASETKRGIVAERAAQLAAGTEVFFKYGRPRDDGSIGQHGIIKKVWQDKTPVTYDVQDPEPESNGNRNVYTVKAPDLIPVPRAGQQLTTFTHGADVVARYPDTDTLYNAKVRGFQKGKYTLEFEGEERNPQTGDIHVYEVEKRFVLDGKLF